MINRRQSFGLMLALPFAVMTSTSSIADEPPTVSGTWTWKWKDGKGETHRHVLVIEGSGDSLVGRERFDDEPAVKVDDLKLSGKSIRFSVTRKAHQAAYQGKFTAPDTISGDVTVTIDGQASEFGWSAAREAGKSL